MSAAMAELDSAVASGSRQDVTQEQLDELRAQLDEMNKSNALLEMENEVFESYLHRHHQVCIGVATSAVYRNQFPQ